MQDEPETSATSAPEDGSPRTIAPSVNPGAANPAPAYETAQVDDGAMPSPRPNGGAGAVMPAYVYAIGRIEPRFPTLSAEKEFAQATGRAETAGLTDRQALQEVLSQRQNRYLVRQLCWVLTVEGLDTYILHPRDPADLDLLVEALRPTPRLTDVDCVVGNKRADRPARAMQRADGADRGLQSNLLLRRRCPDQVDPAAGEGHRQGLRRRGRGVVRSHHANADNAGATDEHRALNYLAMRYPAIYAKAAEEFGRDFSLTAAEVRLSPLSATRKIVEVIFAYTNRNTDFTEKFFVRVDVSEEFPFLVTKLAPYFDL
jgi:hypothetical protein